MGVVSAKSGSGFVSSPSVLRGPISRTEICREVVARESPRHGDAPTGRAGRGGDHCSCVPKFARDGYGYLRFTLPYEEFRSVFTSPEELLTVPLLFFSTNALRLLHGSIFLGPAPPLFDYRVQRILWRSYQDYLTANTHNVHKTALNLNIQARYASSRTRNRARTRTF